MGKHRVCYFYDGARPWLQNCLDRSIKPERIAKSAYVFADDVSGLYYGPKHPMKPQRLTMTHHLVLAYDLQEHFDMYVRILLISSLRLPSG
jgi:hypothetical protein